MYELPNQTQKDPLGITHISNKRALNISKTDHKFQKEFFWEGLKSYVRRFMVECFVCQQNKVETVKTPGLLQPSDIPC